ncbi:MAG: 1-acyl-sn-glycerol-3-phosphate acyltransferase [Leptospira sp.]|nr:1-acyl-sn-glycerol-3-phosphate acyltransferase [Leptospira sp.]
MSKLSFFVTLCYGIPILLPIYPIGLFISYLLKITKFDDASDRINNLLAYLWYRIFFILARRKLVLDLEKWKPENKNRFLICNHTNSLEVPLVVALPFLSGSKDVHLSYLGGDIIQRYKIIPLMMHARIVEAVIYSEKKPNFRNFKTDVLRVLKKRSIFLYPEGERTYTEEIRPFQTGVLKIAYKFQIDLDVFVVSGLMGFSDESIYSEMAKDKKVYFSFCGTVSAKDHIDFETYLNHAQKLMKDKKKELEMLHNSSFNGKSF